MEEVFTNIQYWLAEIGVWAYVIAPVLMAVVSILPIPAEAPAMANGILFGPLIGTLISWIGAMAGAWISYEIARRWGRPLAGRFVAPNVAARLEGGAERAGWWGLLVLRLVPVIAFTGINWGSGLCKVPRWRFMWTTALGIVPGVILFTTTGVGLGALWRRSPAMTGAIVVGVLLVTALWMMRKRQPKVA